MEKEINLEEICDSYVRDKIDEKRWSGWWEREDVYNAMREACRQVLELASENATTVLKYNNKEISFSTIVDKQSITNTINQVK